MPTEVRHLLFKSPEVVQAVSTHFRRSGKPLAAGYVKNCAIVGDGIRRPVAFQVRIQADGGTGRIEEVEVDDVTLVAALIMHCREKGIPLSAKANKSLQVISDQICLIATLS